MILTVFDGEKGPRRDAVILNAAAALVVGGVVPELETAIDAAVDTIDSGAALAKLDELVAFTRGAGAGGGVSGYLTRLSGDIRRDAPEPARGFADALPAARP